VSGCRTEPLNGAENGGGGNRTRVRSPAKPRKAARFRVVWRVRFTNPKCVSCYKAATVQCLFTEQTQWWRESLFGLCDDCLALFQEGTGWIYFIRAGDHVKIGYSQDAEKRMRELSTGSAHELELLHKQRGTVEDEHWLHNRFAIDRTHGEWFVLSDALRTYIARASAGPA
jgi:hypothetical protein